MNIDNTKKEIVEYCLKKKVLITPALLSTAQTISDVDAWIAEHEKNNIQQHPPFQNSTIHPPVPSIHSQHHSTTEQYFPASFEILYNYTTPPRKIAVQDFVNYLRSRFTQIEKLLSHRQELSSLSTIAHIRQKPPREKSSFIGMIVEKQVTKNKHIILNFEDVTGNIKCLVAKSSQIYSQAEDIVDDEIVGIVGAPSQGGLFFVENIIIPDIQLYAEKKQCPDDVYCAILTDMQIGAIDFMEEQFLTCIKWIQGEQGTPEEKEIASKISYLLVVGDAVDGVGIHPRQEAVLKIPDVDEQYKKLSEFLRLIPDRIHIFLSVGNHDASRLSEPQPPLMQRFTKHFEGMNNITFISNPSTILLHKTPTFTGLKFLLYHGCSYLYYAERVPSIKNSGRKIAERTELVMKFLLQRRHLAPSYGSWLCIPDAVDNMVISDIPDVFVSGHLHRPATSTYRGTTIICGSCWQPQNEYQKRQNHEPLPGIMPLFNFKTREVTFIDFSGGIR